MVIKSVRLVVKMDIVLEQVENVRSIGNVERKLLLKGSTDYGESNRIIESNRIESNRIESNRISDCLIRTTGKGLLKRDYGFLDGYFYILMMKCLQYFVWGWMLLFISFWFIC